MFSEAETGEAALVRRNSLRFVFAVFFQVRENCTAAPSFFLSDSNPLSPGFESG